MNFLYCNTLETYASGLAQLTTAPLALDTETMVRSQYEGKGGSALDPHTGRISLVIVQHLNQTPIIFDLVCLEALGYDPDLLVKALDAAEYLLGANIKFDAKQLRGTLGYTPKKLRDVMLLAKLISNATGSKAGKAVGHSLGDLTREYLNIHLTGKGTLQKSTWATGVESRTLNNEWWVSKLTYAADDVVHLFPLQSKMLPVLETPLPDSPLTQTGNEGAWGFGMSVPVNREFRLIPATAEMEYNGLPVSAAFMAAFQQAVRDALDSLGVYLCKELKLDTPQKDWSGREVPSLKALKILRSATGLLELIRKALDFKKIDNVQAGVLQRMLSILDALAASKVEDPDAPTSGELFINEDEESLYSELTELEHCQLVAASPLVQAILDFKRLTKQDGMDLRKYVNPATGRIHPSYSQIGAATGRYASSGPNAQQISNKTRVLLDGFQTLGLAAT